MPYDIRKVKDGYKVCKKGTKKCFSNDPIPLSNAVKQRKAIAISEHKKGGKLENVKLEGCGYFDDYDWSKVTQDERREKIYDYIRDLPDNKEHFAIDEEIKGGDIDWWGIAKDVGSKILNYGVETEEEKEARIKKEEACKLCNEGKEMSGGAIPINKKLYEKAKEIVYPLYKKPSAYRSGAVVKKYKELGGKFKEKGERKLARWFEEEWKDVGDKEYPVYRPTKRINKNTPLTPSEIDPENLIQQIKEKQIIKGDKNLKPFKGGYKCPITGKEICECKGGKQYEKDKYNWFPNETTKELKAYNKRTPGLFKVEFEGKSMYAMCSKLYFVEGENYNKYSCKGIQKNQNEISKDRFHNVLFNNVKDMCINKGFRVINNEMITYIQHKKGLSYYYDKRQVLPDGVSTIPLNI